MHSLNRTYSLTRTTRHLIVAACAVFLLGAQQAALVHLIGHFSAAAKAVTPPGNGEGSGSPSNLAHVCTTCLAYTAMAAAAPLPVPLPVYLPVLAATLVQAEFSSVAFNRTLPYAARAPPVTL
ncbi:MAG: hypothetical protein HY066_11895 [Betaproteobacteria bacterium]|nr:hypothetical protein [Betaproteobacteria bacterium]